MALFAGQVCHLGGDDVAGQAKGKAQRLVRHPVQLLRHHENDRRLGAAETDFPGLCKLASS
jgi:hypothetical protein